MGDSITHYGQTASLYKYYFGERKVLNMGQGGDRTQNVLWRLQNGEVEGIQPKIAFLMIGTNNLGRGETPADTVLGIKAVLAELKQRLPSTKVVLFSIFPRGGAIMDSITKVNGELPALADGKQVVHVDLGLYHTDFVHLAGRGYQIWWEKTEPFLAEALDVAPLPPAVPVPERKTMPAASPTPNPTALK
ncbi:MAG: hypothetical protein EBS96_03395 [Spartobacteria bacterium]|nr:hypothetical protein [Spartobacteria bacterium]